MGDELRNAAITSLAVTLVLIALYIIFRFHTWRLSVGASFAVLHDPILVLGVFSITQTKFDLAVVAAILAVIGYSLNDTVIVFDRIRENFEKNRRLPPDQTLDNAINQTLSRTIMTKVVTCIVVVALLVLGGESLRGFSEALLIGILAGTYSSIYISSSIRCPSAQAETVFQPVSKDPSTNFRKSIALRYRAATILRLERSSRVRGEIVSASTTASSFRSRRPVAPERRETARVVGLALAMLTRIALLFSIVWLTRLTTPWFSVMGQEFSGRDIILLLGGLFLLAKSVTEIHGTLEGTDEQQRKTKVYASFTPIVFRLTSSTSVLADSLFRRCVATGDQCPHGAHLFSPSWG